MEYNLYLTPLNGAEMMETNGGNAAAYDTGYSLGYFVGSCIKDWLFCMSFK